MRRLIKIVLSIVLLIPISFVTIRLGKIILFSDGIAILGYHQIMEDDIKDKYYKNNVYVMKKSVFETQMKYLYDEGYTTLTLQQLEDYYEGKIEIPKKSVVLTFDDGSLTFKEIVKPILEKYNFHATCFVIGSKLLAENDGLVYHYQYLRKEDLVSDDYVSYYSHSYDLHHKQNNRAYVDLKTKEELIEDLYKNEGLVDTTYYAYPYGIHNQVIRTVLEENGVRLAFGYNENRKMIRTNNRYALPRFLMFDFMPMFYFKWII